MITSRRAHHADPDVAQHLTAIADARSSWANALRALTTCADRDATLADVAAEATALARILESRAKTPPPPDSVALLGAISTAERRATLDEDWDTAVRAVRDAERTHDLAVLDLATARGEHA